MKRMTLQGNRPTARGFTSLINLNHILPMSAECEGSPETPLFTEGRMNEASIKEFLVNNRAEAAFAVASAFFLIWELNGIIEHSYAAGVRSLTLGGWGGGNSVGVGSGGGDGDRPRCLRLNPELGFHSPMAPKKRKFSDLSAAQTSRIKGILLSCREECEQLGIDEADEDVRELNHIIDKLTGAKHTPFSDVSLFTFGKMGIKIQPMEWRSDGETEAKIYGNATLPGARTVEDTRKNIDDVLKYSEAGCRILINALLIHVASNLEPHASGVAIAPKFRVEDMLLRCGGSAEGYSIGVDWKKLEAGVVAADEPWYMLVVVANSDEQHELPPPPLSAPAGNTFLLLLPLLFSLSSQNFFLPGPHLLLLLLLLAGDFVWGTPIHNHDGTLRAMPIRWPRECVIRRNRNGAGRLSSSSSSGLLSASSFGLVLNAHLFPLLCPFRRLLGRYALLLPRLTPGPLFVLESLTLGLRLRTGGRFVVGYLLRPSIRSSLLVNAVWMLLRPFVVPVDDSRLEVGKIVKNLLTIL
ncbi:hypothetical protein BDZ97DRAFT_2058247 [Flammula alnicola]|nr:hypothetical protein BDZ97DRAFT_2058247 [Flammula alnicola]